MHKAILYFKAVRRNIKYLAFEILYGILVCILKRVLCHNKE